MMRHLRISTRRMTIVLLSIVLPLSSYVCSWSPSVPQENGPTATSSPKASQGNVLAETPTPTASAGNLPARPTAATAPSGSKYSLEISWQGTLSNVGFVAHYGPDTAPVTLNKTNANTYEGSYSGEFHGAVTGVCNASITWPASFEVTASEHGSGDLDVSVKTSLSKPTTVGSCQGLAGSPRVGAIIVAPQAFTLPAEDGASKTYTADPITWPIL